MKKLINNICIMAMVFLLAGVSEATAQSDDFRSGAPEAGPARKVEIGKYETFELDNGLQVIVVENHKRPRISYQLFIDRDPIVEGTKAGYTAIAGDLMTRGTANRTKAEIDEAVDFVGGSMSTNSQGGFASSLTKHTDVVLELFADAILAPSFPAEEFDKIKTQMISGLQASKDDPSAISGNVSSALNYGLDHPYGEMMTEITLENISVEDCQNYYDLYFVPNNAYMVVVGDIKPKEARDKIEEHFGSWESGDFPSHEYESPAMPEATQVDFVDKAGAVQSVIRVTYPVEMQPGSEDVIPARVMNTILGSGFSGRLFMNLREDKGYTYGAYSSLSSDPLVSSFTASASVRNEVTDSAITEFMYELERLASEPVTQDELDLAKSYISGSFARNLESPQTVANFALNTFRYTLPDDYYHTYLERLEAVSIDDIQAMAQKYIKPGNARIVVVGNEGEVSEKLAQFDKQDGKVTFYDIYANEKAPAMDAGDITGEEIIEGYLEAIGGRAAIDAVQTMKQELTTSMMGQDVDILIYQMAPNMFAMTMSMPGMVIMKQVFDGEQGYMEQMGQKMPLEGETLDQMKNEAQMVPELNMVENGYTFDVGGVEDVNGSMAYKMTATDANGKSTVYFFDKESGLKVKTVATQDAQGQTMTITTEFHDYAEVGGIMVPHLTKVSGMAPVPLEMKVKNVEINGEIDPSVFQ